MKHALLHRYFFDTPEWIVVRLQSVQSARSGWMVVDVGPKRKMKLRKLREQQLHFLSKIMHE